MLLRRRSTPAAGVVGQFHKISILNQTHNFLIIKQQRKLYINGLAEQFLVQFSAEQYAGRRVSNRGKAAPYFSRTRLVCHKCVHYK